MSYNLGVPQSSQQIKNTTSAINTNFVVANTDFGVDHVDFTNAAPPGGNGGLHNKVSLLKQAADPTAAANTPIVFSENVTHPAATVRTEEFIREASGDGGTVIALTNFFNAPITAVNGSSFLPGIPAGVSGSYTTAGAIIKWGFFTTNAGGTATVTFASPFPNACFVVIPAVIDTGAPTVADSAVYAFSYSTSGFSATGTKRVTKAALALNASYIAIGN